MFNMKMFHLGKNSFNNTSLLKNRNSFFKNVSIHFQLPKITKKTNKILQTFLFNI